MDAEQKGISPKHVGKGPPEVSKTPALHEIGRAVFCLSVGIERSIVTRDLQTSPPHQLRITRFIRKLIVHRPGYLVVSPESLLMGCQAGLDPHAFAALAKGIFPEVTPMAESPHVQLLRLAAASATLTDSDILHSDYWRLAQIIRSYCGEFFGAYEERDVIDVARSFTTWALSDSPRKMLSGWSDGETEILVARVPHSSKFQIIDGHHRVAKSIVRGTPSIPVRRTWLSTGVPFT
jgi:hypothetical protein